MKAELTLPHDCSAFFDTPQYWDAVERFFSVELENDGEDITSYFCIEPEKNAVSHIKAKESGILAGEEEILSFFRKEYPDMWIEFRIHSGDSFEENNVVAVVSGNAQKILKCERVMLNVLSRMSGIATQTKMIQSLSTTPLSATRKTQWSYLDKKAVHIGGGLTHRMGLFDAVLMKENHHLLSNAQYLEKESLQHLSKYQHYILEKALFFEREVETTAEFFQAFEGALEFFSLQESCGKCVPQVIMLDNFSSAQIHHSLQDLDQQGYDHCFRRERSIFLEASGGITKSNISEYDIKGIDVLSLGVLTNAVRSLDFSLRIQE